MFFGAPGSDGLAPLSSLQFCFLPAALFSRSERYVPFYAGGNLGGKNLIDN